MTDAGWPRACVIHDNYSVVIPYQKVNSAVRSWHEQADKHAITQQLGVQLRDLRLLDPQLHASYPSALLSRDKALVVNLEHIKCIITKDEILILNADEESVVRLGIFFYHPSHLWRP